MKLLLIDPLGNALDLAMRAQNDGHKVKHFIRQTPKTEWIGRGLVDVVADFKPWLRWADLVFNSDCTKYLRDLDNARREGIAVCGASENTAQWELDRTVGMQVLRRHGIDILPSVEFTNYDKAIAHVKSHDKRFVSKPSGIVEDKSLSYVAKSPADLVYMLERWKKLGKQQQFILQDYVEGTEFAVGGWFGPGGWNAGWCENFEFKKLMNGDLGVATGEQGTVLRYVKSSKLARKVLLPLTDTLARENYVGYIDVNCIVEDNGNVWPLEFTMRPGWPTMNIQLALQDGDSAQWLLDLAEGVDARRFILNVTAVGVVMSVPDYPYSHLTRKEVIGIPIYGPTPALWKHIHPCEMMMKEAPDEEFVHRPMACTAGDYILVMTATGETVRETADTVYRRLKRLVVPNSPQYRTDIGERLAKQLPKLQANGYAVEWHYSMASRPSKPSPASASRSNSSSPANLGTSSPTISSV